MSAPSTERTELLAELSAWLDAAQVLVLTGPPGIGKSTVAAALSPDAWVSAEAGASAEALVGRAARALGCPVERPEAVLEALDTIDLLVVDGIEGSEGLDPLLEAWSARTRVVVTSRQRLPRWPASVEVGPLTPAQGAAVLRAHVADRQRAEALPQAPLEALADALDGVPLALAVVADRLRLYEPEALLQSVTALGRGEGGRLGDTLTEALALGLDALSPEARTALTAASALPGAFDVATLAALVGGDVDDAVLELLDASLLRSSGSPPRLRLLAPVRAAVRHRADADGLATARARLADHVLPRAEAAAAAGTPEALAHLGAMRDQLDTLTRSDDASVRLRAAIALAARERRTGPAQAVLARDARLPDEGPRELRVAWGLLVVHAALGLLQPDTAEAVLTRLDPLFDETTCPDERAARSFLALVRGDAGSAAALAREAIALRPEPRFHLRLGIALFDLGQQDEAAEAFQQARADTDPFRRGHATYGLCTALMEKQAPPEALLQLVAAAEADHALAYPWLACRLHFLRASALASLGELDAARDHYAQAGRMHQLLGESPSALFMELNARLLDLAAGEVPTSVLTLPMGDATAFGRAMLTVLRATTHAALGHHDAAEAIGGPAVAELQALSPREARFAGSLLAVALAAARPAVAARFLPEGDEPVVALARRVLAGEALAREGSVEQRIFAGLVGLTRTRAAVARDGTTFVGDDGSRVDIARRKVLARVLAALATAEEPLDVDALCAQVWPGERMVGQSGTRRVHVAISTLRGLGLRAAIETLSDGDTTRWRLDADVLERV